MARSLMALGATVALIAMYASSASAAQINFGRMLLQTDPPYEFPPLCECERDASTSPWRLALSESGTVDGYIKHCYTVVNVGCDSPSKCCQGSQGVEKVEFDVEDGCKDSLKRVTINGNYKSFEYNTNLDVLRITNLGLAYDQAAGTEVCLLFDADATCTTLDQLCGLGGACKYAIFNADRDCCPVSLVGAAPPPVPSPSPPFGPAIVRPPPPSPSLPPAPPSFPYCKCERDPAQSKLYVEPVGVRPDGNLTYICFTVSVKDSCAAGSSCCEFTLFKFEMDANPACKDSLVFSTLDGARRVRQFQSKPYPVIKVNNINKPFSAVEGTEVCVVLRPPCNSLAALCPNGKCEIALFTRPGSSPSCCPLTSLPTAP